VPAPLVVSTIKTGLLLAAGQAAEASVLAANAVALMERMVYLMRIIKLKFAAAVVLGVSLVTGATYHGLAGQTPTKQTAKGLPAEANRLVAAEKRAPVDEEKKAAVSIKEMPPVVVRTVPQAGDTEVDAAKVTEIRVTFSKDMMDKSWSWTRISDETFPKTNGEVRYDKDQRTCILPVKLEAGKTYVIWLNSEKFENFKDADGRPAVPYLLVFETKPAM
jgi:RNA polymerase sigma-70 factor (ECF subfamily)